MGSTPSYIKGRGFLRYLCGCMKNCSKITKFMRKFSISAYTWGLDFSVYNRLYYSVGQNMTWSTGRRWKDTRRTVVQKKNRALRTEGCWQCICFFHDAPRGIREKRQTLFCGGRNLRRGRFAYSTLLSLSTIY